MHAQHCSSHVIALLLASCHSTGYNRVAARTISTRHQKPNEVAPGFTFSFLKKISVATENGIPAEISRFSGNFDRKELSNSKFRNFGFPAGISLYFTGIPVHFTEK